jgi:DNA-binding CsgD family transcriptional regulator
MIVLDSIPGTGKASSPRRDEEAWGLAFGQEQSISVIDDTVRAGTPQIPVPDIEEGSSLVHADIKALGFEWMEYIRLSRIGDRFHMRDFVQVYAPRQWVRRYLEAGYVEIDPRVQIACRKETPLVWDLPLLAEGRPIHPVNRRCKEFLKAADAAGVRSGVVFGVADANGIDHAVLSFYSTKESRIWIADNTVGQCYAAGLRWHSLLGTVANTVRTVSPDVELSDIQRSALELMINGMSSREIGEALNTSVQNVDYHIRELRRKFGARNRVQLAYAAGRLLVG